MGSVNRRIRQAQHKCETLSEKKVIKAKRSWPMAQVIEYLPSKSKSLNSTASTAKEKIATEM
jgi:hypothetical protein